MTSPENTPAPGQPARHAGAPAPGSEPASAAPAAPPTGTGDATDSRRRRPLIMGILNITPDSFSDGGDVERPTDDARTAASVAKAQRLVAEGAAMVDVGGESTRPGAERVPQHDEAGRVLPVVERLVDAGVPVSVDTMYAQTARDALRISDGAAIINDVSGGQSDDGMLPLLAETGATFVLSHWRGHSIVMNSRADYVDPATEILDELAWARDRAVAAGLANEQIVLDPGLGFAKRTGDNWAVLRSLDRFRALGHPLLIGASRKRFTGELLSDDAPMADRDLPTAIISALCAEAGVWGLRVHNVAATDIALDVIDAWTNGGEA
ncbi:MAG: dihydropteroate synthase [Pseudoclavibacter sp.]